MKTILTTIVTILFLGVVWGQDLGKVKSLVESSQNTFVDSTQQTEDDKLKAKIKEIISEENADATEIGFFTSEIMP